MSSQNLHEEVVAITYDYLGPAADRFVTRQIRNHLQKDPEDLQKNDLKQLIDWIDIAMRLLSDDMSIVDKYVADLQGLTVKTKKRSPRGKRTS